jgi:hypothetical protein
VNLFPIVSRNKAAPSFLRIPDRLFCLLLVGCQPFNPFTPRRTVIINHASFSASAWAFPFGCPLNTVAFSIGIFSRRTSCPALP